jgi:hypothetical protein
MRGSKFAVLDNEDDCLDRPFTRASHFFEDRLIVHQQIGFAMTGGCPAIVTALSLGAAIVGRENLK